jgi:hypothetical protein
MPVIHLNGDGNDRHRLLAVMAYPKNERKRFIAYERALAAEAIENADDREVIEVSVMTLRALLDGPSRSEARRSHADAVRAGIVAGDLLAMIYLLATVAKIPKMSVNKAVHAYLNWSATGATWRDGKSLPKSESVVRAAWSSHKNVSHLWGAMRMNRVYPFAEKRQEFGKAWNTYLEIAAELLAFGLTFTPSHMRSPTPILDAKDAWRLPPTIAARQLKTNQLPDALMGFVKGYKAPQPMR